jgi:hypothetical protein
MIPGLNDGVCRRDYRLEERSGFRLTRKCSEIDVLHRRACYEIKIKNSQLRNAKLSIFIRSR